MKSLYVIFDTRAEAIIGEIVQTARVDAVAVRSFGDLLRDERSLLGQHPADFQLVCVGHMNDVGEIVPERRVVLTGQQFIDSQKALQAEE